MKTRFRQGRVHVSDIVWFTAERRKTTQMERQQSLQVENGGDSNARVF